MKNKRVNYYFVTATVCCRHQFEATRNYCCLWSTNWRICAPLSYHYCIQMVARRTWVFQFASIWYSNILGEMACL